MRFLSPPSLRSARPRAALAHPLTSPSRARGTTATKHASRTLLTPLMVAAKHDQVRMMCSVLCAAMWPEQSSVDLDDGDSEVRLVRAFGSMQLAERSLSVARISSLSRSMSLSFNDLESMAGDDSSDDGAGDEPAEDAAARAAGGAREDDVLPAAPTGVVGPSRVLSPPLHATVDALDRDGHTALYHAAANGAAAATTLLLSVGASVEMRTNKGRTPLLIAARRGHLDVVNALIRAQAHVDARSNNGVTPIFTAANKGHTAVVCALLDAGACANSCDNLGYTPLFIACQHGHTAAARALLAGAPGARGANMEIGQQSGFTPLHVACHAGMDACVALLLEQGAAVNALSNQVCFYLPLHFKRILLTILTCPPHILTF